MNLQAAIDVPFRLSGWTAETSTAYEEQWVGLPRHPDAGWDWHEVFRRHTDADRLEVAVWVDRRLAGLAIGLCKSGAVEIRFLEGDPKPDCRLRGRRALIVLECAACYAQLRGRVVLRVQPANERLSELYTTTYGFCLEKPARGSAYLVKRI